MSGTVKASRVKSAPVVASTPVPTQETKPAKSAPKTKPAPVVTPDPKPAPNVKIVRAGVTQSAKSAPVVTQETAKTAPKSPAKTKPAPVVASTPVPTPAKTKPAPKPAPVVASPAKTAPKLPASRKTDKLTGGTSVGSAKPATKPAPVVVLKPRVKGFKPFSASTSYEPHKSVALDGNAVPQGWEAGRVDWTKAPYHLAVYSRAGVKSSELLYPADTYFRTVAWMTVQDAMGFVDAMVKLNTPKVMKSGAVKVSIYRNGTLVAQNDSGVWTMKPVVKSPAVKPAKTAPKSPAKSAPVPTQETAKPAKRTPAKSAPVVVTVSPAKSAPKSGAKTGRASTPVPTPAKRTRSK